MQTTRIEYATHSWNPVVMRCTPVGAGCQNCWHLRTADRMQYNPQLPDKRRQVYAGKGAPYVTEEVYAPQHRQAGARIAVQFMGDLFHPDASALVPIVFSTMISTPQHQYLVLTKRPQRMLEYLQYNSPTGYNLADNIWLGVSVEDQETADRRLPSLVFTPGAHRWVSLEPLLGPVDIRIALDPATGGRPEWVVAGCESGPGRRSVNRGAFRSLRSQCRAAGVPFYLKQMEVGGRVEALPGIDGDPARRFPPALRLVEGGWA